MGKKPNSITSKLTNRKELYCSGCDSDKPTKDFYKSNGTTDSGYIPYCKDCCYKYSLDSNNNFNIEKFKEMLQKIDKPFIYNIWNTNESKIGVPNENGTIRCKTLKSAIGYYIKDVSMKQYRDFKYKDSIFEPIDNKNNLNENGEGFIKNKNYIPSQIIEKWGSNYTVQQIEKLEKFNKDMMNSYDVKTASHKDYLKKICKVSLKMDEALDNDNVNEFQKLSTVYDNLMKSAKFTAVQRSAVDDTGGFATFSEFIEALEKEGFIEPAKIEEDYDIVEATISDMKNYTKKLVLGDSSISSMAIEQLAKFKEKEYSEENNFE